MSERVRNTGGGPEAQHLLEARELVKEYGRGRDKVHVLRGLTLWAERGELVLVVGASGAGKSTLLHILGLLDPPTSGEVLYQGQDLYQLGARQQARHRNRLFGFVFQFFHLLPDFTALENVLMPAIVGGYRAGKSPGRREARQRALMLLERIGLADRAKHRPSELSGGERQRVAIARALMNEPDVLFMDEPTGNLDTGTSAQIHDLIWELNQALGQTIVLVTHDEEIARRKARILRIRDGRIIKP
jgi:lipoprotein-releasing system ATP-binding protein